MTGKDKFILVYNASLGVGAYVGNDCLLDGQIVSERFNTGKTRKIADVEGGKLT